MYDFGDGWEHEVLLKGILPPAPETRFRGNVITLMERNRRAGLEITPRTTIPRWYGDRMDDGQAVDGLLAREVQGRETAGHEP